MSVYIGPCSYGTPEPDSDERYITADSNETSNVISVEGELDMKQERIVNVGQPREGSSDATTVGYVHQRIGLLSNRKVDWDGGTMTGELSMGSYKLTHVGNPEDDEDGVNKQYVDNLFHKTSPYTLGRYLVFPHVDNRKSYFAIGSSRNINLSNGKIFELFNDTVHGSEYLTGSRSRTLVPLRGKDEVIMHLDKQHTITPNLPKPWTILFSTKPDNPPRSVNDITLSFAEQAPGVSDNIVISWSENTFTYTVSGLDPVMIEIDTKKLNHFAFEYSGKRLTVWVNGMSKRTHTNLSLNNCINMLIGVNFIGVIAIFNRDLSKQEIVEHFVEYHVKPFTDAEVS